MALNPPLLIPTLFDPGTLIQSAQVNANFSTLTNAVNANSRNILATPITFYVAPNGTDSGIPTNSAQPAATVNYVLNLIWSNYDAGNQNILIQLADGIYNQSISVTGRVIGQRIPNQLTIQGNLAVPTNVVINGNPVAVGCSQTAVTFQGMRLIATNTCLIVHDFARANFQNVDFNAAGLDHIAVKDYGLVTCGNYSISAGATNHWHALSNGVIESPTYPNDGTAPVPGLNTITLLGTPNFSGAFALASGLGFIRSLGTFQGTATGVRYNVSTNAVINNGGRNDIPGNAPGSVTTGGQYV